jgi:hypothetical protein
MVVLALVFLTPLAGSGISSEDLYGTWRLLSFTQRVVATGETSEAFGRSPRGFLNYGRDGRMYGILVRDDRPRPKDMSTVTTEQRAELLNTMISYAGSFTVDGNTVTHHVDISWNENWTGTNQVRHIALRGEKLYITTDPQPSGIDGRMVVAELVWEKVR